MPWDGEDRRRGDRRRYSRDASRARARARNAFVFLFGVVTIALLIQTRHIQANGDRLDRQQRELVVAQRGSCDRVNRLRANDNKSAATQYATIQLAERLVGDDLLTVRRFRRLRMRLDYISRTNCDTAVGTPALYSAPDATPLSELTMAQRIRIEKEGYP